jgi:hypothetical protein
MQLFDKLIDTPKIPFKNKIEDKLIASPKIPLKNKNAIV